MAGLNLSSNAGMLGLVGAVTGGLSGAKGAAQRTVGQTLKRVAVRAGTGAAIGAATGTGADYLERKSKETPANDYANRYRAQHLANIRTDMRKLQKTADDLQARFELIRDSLADKALQDAEKQPVNFLDDIDCQVCHYHGKPTNEGLCPECGAVGGVPPADDSVPAEIYGRVEEMPRDGQNVYALDMIERMSFPW